MRPTLTLAAVLVLTGCAGAEPAAEPSMVTTTVTASSTSSPVTIAESDWTDRFVMSHKSWLDEVIRIDADEDAQTFEMTTTLKRPRDSETAREMCRALSGMAKASGHSQPIVTVYGFDEQPILMARSTADRRCFRI